jgi:hypothetical protein
MSSLQQRLAETTAHLNAQLCELNELRERARKALLSEPPQLRQWKGPGAISRSSPKMDREPALGRHWKGSNAGALSVK